MIDFSGPLFRAKSTAMKNAPIQVRLNSKVVLAELKRQKEKSGKMSFKTTALSLMPKGVKWFESGEDFGFALWLERMVLACQERGNHVSGTYTFKDKGAKF